MAKTHNIGAILAGITFYNAFNYETPSLETAIFFGSCIIASTLADISHPESRVGRKIRPISSWINHRIGHRSLTHSLLSVVFILTYHFCMCHIKL